LNIDRGQSDEQRLEYSQVDPRDGSTDPATPDVLGISRRREVVETEPRFRYSAIHPELQLFIGDYVFWIWAVVRDQTDLSDRAPAGEHQITTLDMLWEIFLRSSFRDKHEPIRYKASEIVAQITATDYRDAIAHEVLGADLRTEWARNA
jgi:hypothetical protein